MTDEDLDDVHCLDTETVAALRARAAAVLLQPNLGLATTAELLDELRARFETAGLLAYTTVGGNPP